MRSPWSTRLGVVAEAIALMDVTVGPLTWNQMRETSSMGFWGLAPKRPLREVDAGEARWHRLRSPRAADATRTPGGSRQRYATQVVALLTRYGLLVIAVITLNFALPRLLPGDPLTAGSQPNGPPLSAEQERQLRATYHLDQPLAAQFQ